jgi:hypothetical protein
MVIGLVLLGLALILRIALVFALPPVLKKVAHSYGLSCTYERLDLSLLGCDAELWHLVVADEKGGDPYVDAEYCRADLAVLALFTGKLVVRRVEVDGLDVAIDRDQDGNFRCSRTSLRRRRRSRSRRSRRIRASRSTSPRRSRSTPVRLQKVNVRYRDASVTPPLDHAPDGEPERLRHRLEKRPARLEVEMSAPPVLDVMRVEGQVTSRAQNLSADLEVEVDGVHLQPLAGYLERVQMQPLARSLDLRMRAKVETTAAPSGPNALAIHATLLDVAAVADGAETLALDRLALEAESRRTSLAIARVELSGARASAERTAEGWLRAAGVQIGKTPANQPSASPAPPAAPAPAPPAEPRTSPPFDVTVDTVVLGNISLTWHDASVEPAADLKLAVQDVTFAHLLAEPGNLSAPANVKGRVELPGVIEAVTLSGTMTPFAVEKKVDLALRGEQVRFTALAPYLGPLGITPTLENGTLSCRLSAQARSTAEGKLIGEAAFADLVFSDREPLLALGGLRIEGAELDPGAASYQVASIEMTGPTMQLARDGEGALHLLGLRYQPRDAKPPRKLAAAAGPAPEGEPAPAPTTAEAPAHGKPPRITIGKIGWHGVQVTLADAMVEPPITVQLADAGVELSTLVVDLDPNAPAPAPVTVRAWLAAPDLVERAVLTGSFVPNLRAPSAELAADVRGLTLASLREQLGKLGVEPALTAGSLELKMKADAELLVDSTRASLSLDGVHYRDGDTELAGLDGLDRARSGDVAGGPVDRGARALAPARERGARGGRRAAWPAVSACASRRPAAEETLRAADSAARAEASRARRRKPGPTPPRVTEMPLCASTTPRSTGPMPRSRPPVATSLRAKLEVHDTRDRPEHRQAHAVPGGAGRRSEPRASARGRHAADRCGSPARGARRHVAGSARGLARRLSAAGHGGHAHGRTPRGEDHRRRRRTPAAVTRCASA